MSIDQWDDMNFWSSGEWQAAEERLELLHKKGIMCCPQKENLFAALDATPLANVRCVLVGQDPYPNPDLATGVAFSVPKGVTKFPPTLVNFLDEYSTDTHLPTPKHGDLTKWCKQGVLLWNAIPSCEAWKSLSHASWPEYSYLNKEIIELAAARDAVFVFLGGYARDLKKYLPPDFEDKWVIETSHPSPRGVKFSKTPFLGSRIFTRVNEKLCMLGVPTIDWSLK